MKKDRITEAIGGIDDRFIAEAMDYKYERRITMSKRRIAVVAAVIAVMICGAAAVWLAGNASKPKTLTLNGDMTNSIAIKSLSFESGTPQFEVEVLDSSMLPFDEEDIILAVYGEFDISDSDGNFIAHVDCMALNSFPYDPNKTYWLGGINDDPKESYVATGETETELTVLRTEQEDGSWEEDVRIYFTNVYYDTESGEYIALCYDLIVLESGTYNIHIDSLEIACSKGETVEISGDWTTTFTV